MVLKSSTKYFILQDQLPSLLRTAENLRVKGLSEASGNGASGRDTYGHRNNSTEATHNHQNSMFDATSSGKTGEMHLTSFPMRSSVVTTPTISNQNGNIRSMKRSPNVVKKDAMTENSKFVQQSQKVLSSNLSSSVNVSSLSLNGSYVDASTAITSQNFGKALLLLPLLIPV